MEAGKVIIKTVIDTTGIDDGIKNIETKLRSYDFSKTLSNGLSKVGGIVKGLIGTISGMFSVVGSIAKGLISGITRVALRTAGITTAFGAVGVAAVIIVKAFQKIGDENKELMANIKYLVFVISQALAPAAGGLANFIANSINKILNLLAKVITYIAYIVKAWFGINLLAGASVDAFRNAQDSSGGIASNLGKASKNAKDLKKQLAGFDEMNVLQDNTDTSGGTGGGGIGGAVADFVAPSLEFGGEVPEWIKWIAENKELVIAGLLGIAAALLVVKLGLTGLFGGVIVGLIVALVALIIQNWDKIKEVLGAVWGWIDEHIIKPVVALFVWLWNKLVEIFGPIVSFFFDIFSQIWGVISSILGTIWSNIQIIINNVVSLVKSLWNMIIGILKPIATWIWNNVLSPVINFFSGMINTIWGFIRTVATTVGNVIASVFKGVVNGVLGAIEGILNTPIKAINGLISVINKIPGIELGKLKTFSLPRLAKGGIINMPGRGVPVGSAIGGERGQEGVIPLTDSQQMALLGETIGKYININATIPVYVGNRQIARELQKINAENDFAFNR